VSVVRTPLADRLVLHAGTALVGGTGLALAALKYLVEPPADEYGIAVHPWQPLAQHAHVVAAPLLVLAVGMLLRPHVLARLTDAGFRRARRTGLGLAIVVLPVIASGYLLQVATDDAWRRAWVVLHVTSSVAFLASALAHLIAARNVRIAP
jgi:hypothetical protein